MDWKDKLKGLKEVLPEGEVPEIKEETVLEKKGPKIELRVELDKRNGKPATLVTGLDNDEEADSLAKKLKKACPSQRRKHLLRFYRSAFGKFGKCFPGENCGRGLLACLNKQK